MRTKSFALLGLIVAIVSVSSGAERKPAATPAKKPDPAFAKVADTPGLPRVLLIGDSISIGYTADVRDLLQGQANVHRISTNGGPTTNGLKNLKAWLGDGKWDVIHFNWGLHDLKYVGPKDDTITDVTASDSRQQVPLAQYEQNLKTLVTQLQASGARLIWCATTPVPEGAKGRVPGDEVKYNAAAAGVMQAAGVATNDLYGHAQLKLKEIQRRADVHYTPEGYRYLAEKVAAAIKAQLPRK